MTVDRLRGLRNALNDPRESKEVVYQLADMLCDDYEYSILRIDLLEAELRLLKKKIANNAKDKIQNGWLSDD